MSIDQVFDAIDIQLEPFALCELHGRCTLGLGRRAYSVLHYILRGSGEIWLDRNRPIAVKPGSIALVPAYQPHSLRSTGTELMPLPDCRPLAVGIDHIKEQAEPATDGLLLAICGRLDISLKGIGGTIPILRSPIAADLQEGDPVRTALEELVRELSSPRIGTRALTRALMSQCVIILLRRKMAEDEQAMKWLEGLTDESLWSALRAMLDRPRDTHTVESLAREAGMSRTSFAARFSATYGTGPIDLLRLIRLQRAAEILARTDVPVKRVAEMVGYSSRSSFSRAFEVQFGSAPDIFRAQLRARQP